MLKGIDVSRYQRFDDYAVLNHSKRAFVFMKASEGLYSDRSFVTHCEGFATTCLLAGAYHFLRFQETGAAQADHFIKTVKQYYDSGKLQLPPVLDIEDDRENKSPDECKLIIKEWLTKVKDKIGKTPIIYTGGWYWRDRNHMDNTPDFSKYPLWTSRYHKSKYDPMYGGWPKPTFWQFTDRGSIDGLPTAIDEDYFMGDITELWDLAGMTPDKIPDGKIRAVQSMLNHKKFYTGGPPDGDFADNSITGYKQWQESKGLPAQDKITAQNWQLLFDMEEVPYGTPAEISTPATDGVTVAGRNAVVTANKLNIRAGAGTENLMVAQPLNRGQRVVILEERNGWYKVKADVVGWVTKAYVS